jgi:hypothetical protein
MSTYAEFSNAIPTGVNGLAVGSKGSEVTVADSSGNLYQAGTQVTTSATLLNLALSHVDTSSLIMADGTATLDDIKTVATGLTTVRRGFVQRRSNNAPANSSLEPVFFEAIPSSGNLVIRGYGIDGSSTRPTYQVGTQEATVDWIAIGV